MTNSLLLRRRRFSPGESLPRKFSDFCVKKLSVLVRFLALFSVTEYAAGRSAPVTPMATPVL